MNPTLIHHIQQFNLSEIHSFLLSSPETSNGDDFWSGVDGNCHNIEKTPTYLHYAMIYHLENIYQEYNRDIEKDLNAPDSLEEQLFSLLKLLFKHWQLGGNGNQKLPLLDPLRRDDTGRNALLLAAQCGYLNIFQFLERNVTEVNLLEETDLLGRDCLMLACEGYDQRNQLSGRASASRNMVKYLVEECRFGIVASTENAENQDTPLHAACRNTNSQDALLIASYLIEECGASLEWKNPSGEDCSDVAEARQHSVLLEYLYSIQDENQDDVSAGVFRELNREIQQLTVENLKMEKLLSLAPSETIPEEKQFYQVNMPLSSKYLCDLFARSTCCKGFVSQQFDSADNLFHNEDESTSTSASSADLDTQMESLHQDEPRNDNFKKVLQHLSLPLSSSYSLLFKISDNPMMLPSPDEIEEAKEVVSLINRLDAEEKQQPKEWIRDLQLRGELMFETQQNTTQ